MDEGRLDERGHLHLAGRRDAVIITGGEKVQPEEVEAVLRATGEFTEVVVVGVADPEWGQVVAAVYPASGAPQLERVKERLRMALPPWQRPKYFVPLAEWPANTQGKVNRPEAARRAAAAIRAGTMAAGG
jgi:O-succinylbenzoic acid--CoA ligase